MRLKSVLIPSCVSALVLLALSMPAYGQTGVAVVNAASFKAGAPVAPGSLASAFPTDGVFTGATQTAAPSLPLGTELGGTTVTLAGSLSAPLLFVSEGQINFQVPSGAPAGQHTISVAVGGAEVASGTVNVVDQWPGIFFNPADPLEPGAVLNGDSSLNTPDNAEARGGVLVVFGTGQGPLDNAITDGEPAGSDPLSSTTGTVTANISGFDAPVLFSGMAPGFVGLWQVNVQIPADLPVTGLSALFLSVNGLPSNIVSVQISE